MLVDLEVAMVSFVPIHQNIALFQKIKKHLLEDENPSLFLKSLETEPEMALSPYILLQRLQTTEQSPLHHPEGSVWNHTLMVVEQAAKQKRNSKAPTIFMWAALLHDIGKPPTTKKRKGKITSYNHEKVGETLSREFLSAFIEDTAFISSVASLIRFHMQPLFVLNGLPYADIPGMKEYTDIQEVALLGMCDRLGRLGSDPLQEEKNRLRFLALCRASE